MLMDVHWDGHQMASQVHKVHTIVQLELIESLDVILLKLMPWHVSMLAFNLLAQMLKLCQLNGVSFDCMVNNFMFIYFIFHTEYQVGPSLGMKAADDLWVSRYILERVAEVCIKCS